jgi:hypothetical protein
MKPERPFASCASQGMPHEAWGMPRELRGTSHSPLFGCRELRGTSHSLLFGCRELQGMPDDLQGMSLAKLFGSPKLPSKPLRRFSAA